MRFRQWLAQLVPIYPGEGPAVWLCLAVKFVICLSFPFLLRLIRFYQPAELRRIRAGVENVLTRLRLRTQS